MVVNHWPGGTFALYPHDVPAAAAARDPSRDLLPERLHTASRGVGAIRLLADDVRELIEFVAKDFNRPLA